MSKLESIIVTETTRGDGKKTCIRRVIEYWSTDGTLLAVNDPLAPIYTTWFTTDGARGEYWAARPDTEIRQGKRT